VRRAFLRQRSGGGHSRPEQRKEDQTASVGKEGTGAGPLAYTGSEVLRSEGRATETWIRGESKGGRKERPRSIGPGKERRPERYRGPK